MSVANLTPVVRRLLHSAAGSAASEFPDPVLLQRFVTARDEAAFAAIVHRHGRVVFDVCRCVLGNHADAEDAFQATFLILARKAGTVRSSNSLASWLHGVAYRTARKARVAALRRREYEARTPPREPVEPNDRNWGEVQQIIHGELLALPERLRVVLVLCYLEGLTQDRAAEALGLSKAAVRKRLERGRERLRHRLAARGLGPAAILAAFALPPAASAVPTVLIDATVRIASAAGSTAGAVPTHVLTLAAGGTPMTLGKFATAVWLVPALVVGAALAVGAGQTRVAAEQPVAPLSTVASAGDSRDESAPQEETPVAKEAKWLAGEWKVAFVEVAGRSAFANEDISDARFTFKDNKVEVKDFRLLSVTNFSFKLAPTSKPKEIDVTFLEGPWKGDTFVGVYVTLENEVRICLRLEKTNLGRPTGFSTVADAGLYTFFLRPVNEKQPPPRFAQPAPAPQKQPDAAPQKDIPLPAKTPFDGDAKKKEGYLVGYGAGYAWAMGQHFFCPTNPSKDNLHAIRGWIEGWQAGVKAGGTADLPSKYAPYLVWREPDLPLPGGNAPLAELAEKCKGALVATLVEVGKPELGPPGAADYKSAWKVEKVLRGDYPKTADLSFRVQNLPEDKRERTPTVGKKYILITYETNADQIAVILEADEANLRTVQNLLKQ
jgi:RNA polymerase sigma factor (sigma-70 family)